MKFVQLIKYLWFNSVFRRPQPLGTSHPDPALWRCGLRSSLPGPLPPPGCPHDAAGNDTGAIRGTGAYKVL